MTTATSNGVDARASERAKLLPSSSMMANGERDARTLRVDLEANDDHSMARDDGEQSARERVGSGQGTCARVQTSSSMTCVALAFAAVVIGVAASRAGASARANATPALGDAGRANGRGHAWHRPHPTPAIAVRKEFYENAYGKVDELAIAAALDPKYHRYLPDAFHGYDPAAPAETYAHAPVVSKSKTGFTMCVDMPSGAWDTAYVKGFARLFEPGVCVEKIVIGCDQETVADVRIFSQSAFLWRGRNKAKDGSYDKPEKKDPGQVDMYLAHEAVGTFGGDLHRQSVAGVFDYLGYFDEKRSALWWPFGPSLNSLTSDFPAYTTPHKDRIPGIAWLAIDCLPPRSTILSYLSQAFPVFSMGSCMHNAAQPKGLPGRGVEDLKYQSMMAHYMFYFAVENAPMCDGYMTEKIWLALSRGSIPVYLGTSSVDDLLPSKNSYVDLRKYDSIEALATELRAIATNETRYLEYTGWRYEHPSKWSEGFRRLLRVMSSDIKVGICSILQKGDAEYVRAAAIGGCENTWDVFGVPHARLPQIGKPTDPFEHLNKVCDEPTQACYTFKYPGYKFIPGPSLMAKRAAESQAIPHAE